MAAARLDRRVSFGVYLIHLTVLEVFVKFDLPPTVKLVLALIFSVGIASVLFLLLEAPMISLGHRLSARLRPEVRNERLNYPRSV